MAEEIMVMFGQYTISFATKWSVIIQTMKSSFCHKRFSLKKKKISSLTQKILAIIKS